MIQYLDLLRLVLDKGNEVSISNLKDEDASGNKIEYLGFLVFQPDGIKFSNCRVGGPIRNYTWSEMVDPDNEPSLKNPQCFIATATFGSPLHRHVETFRRFRNSYLLPHWWGRVLVDFYYFVSPPLASLVEHSETLKSWSRSLLQPIAESLEEQEASKKSP